MLEQFADLAGKKVHVEKRPLVGTQLEAFGAAVRQDAVHILAVSVSPAVSLSCCRSLCWQAMSCNASSVYLQIMLRQCFCSSCP